MATEKKLEQEFAKLDAQTLLSAILITVQLNKKNAISLLVLNLKIGRIGQNARYHVETEKKQEKENA